MSDERRPEPPRRAARLHPRDRRRPTSRAGKHTDGRHALPARAERLPAHRPRQVDLPELRHRPASSAGRCHLRFDDTNPTKEEQEYIDAIEADVRWLGFDWGEHLYHASDYFEQLYEWAVQLIQARQGLRGRPLAPTRSASTAARSPSPGRNSPWRDRAGRGEPRPLRAHAQGRVPGRRARAAREDRHGLGQHQPARPRAVPHPPRQPPAHRRRLVHLPDLRLRARPVGRDRGHHPLDLHARVRGPPAALRLVPREPARAVAAAADTSSRGST